MATYSTTTAGWISQSACGAGRIERRNGLRDVSSCYDQTQGDPGGGWLDATCTNWAFSTRPSTEADLAVQTAQRRQTGDTETFRIRVDRDAPHGWEAGTQKQDFPEDDGRPASFLTSGDVPDGLVRGLIAELAAGKRMIAQIGDLPVVTLDLDAAKADIVEFRNACERMWRDFARSPRSTARIAIEAIDPFTDGGSLSMNLFHQTSHDGGPQPWVDGLLREQRKTPWRPASSLDHPISFVPLFRSSQTARSACGSTPTKFRSCACWNGMTGPFESTWRPVTRRRLSTDWQPLGR